MRRSAFWQAVAGTVVGGLILAGILSLVGVIGQADHHTVLGVVAAVAQFAAFCFVAACLVARARKDRRDDAWRAATDRRLARPEKRSHRRDAEPLLAVGREFGLEGRVLADGGVEFAKPEDLDVEAEDQRRRE
jgi:hypothetical protein